MRLRRILDSEVFIAVSVGLITFACYVPSLQNDFVYWDDDLYVLKNGYVHSLNLSLLRFAFLEFYAYNWHPLTWLSHALDYAIWGANPWGHHLTSVVVHAVNSALVVLLVMRLIKAAEITQSTSSASPIFRERWLVLLTAAVTGTLFGLHPVHVESVAWIAERKDLLCGLFFLLSILMYLKHAEPSNRHQTQRYWLSQLLNKQQFSALSFFILALLSKPMAVTLPAVLLILDWFPLQKVRSVKTCGTALLEKLPFFALALLSSILTILAQKSGQAVWESLPLTARIPVAIKSIAAYLWSMIVPLNLMPFYPHPRNASFLSLEYAGATVFVAGISVACAVLAKRRKLFLAAWLYYIVTLMPVLGIVQVGGQAMADRYTYLPSLGPFVIVGVLVSWLWRKAEKLSKSRIAVKSAIVTSVLFVLGTFSHLTLQQAEIWSDAFNLWNYVIERQGDKVLIAYYNRGNAYARMKQYDKAIDDFSKVIALNYEEYSKAYTERALAYLAIGQVGLATSDLKKACELGDEFGCATLRYLKFQ